MLGRTTCVALLAVFSATLPAALAQAVVKPCTLGQESDNGCSYCDDTKSIAVTPWFQATTDPSFDMPNAAAKHGGGWDVWWNIPDPGEGCRIILTEPFSTPEGSYNSALSGNVVLSTANAGCYYAHVGNGGVNAAFYCGAGDYAAAGASIPLSKREAVAPKSKQDTRRRRLALGASPNPSKRWGGQAGASGNGQSTNQPAPAPPVTFTAGPATSDHYTKSGPQQVDGRVLNCNGGETCDITTTMSLSAGTSLMNEHSTTITDSTGTSLSVMAGFMIMDGPMGSVTGTMSEDWSHAVTDAMSTTNTNTVTVSSKQGWNTMPGVNFNAWFTPTLSCQTFTLTCNGVDQSVEKCDPVLINGQPDGTVGLMTVN